MAVANLAPANKSEKGRPMRRHVGGGSVLSIALGLRWRLERRLAALASGLLLLAPMPVAAQNLICCNTLVGFGGNWIGASRNCSGALEKAGQAKRQQVCSQLQGAGGVCEEARPYCPACDEEALAKARADYARWMEVYRSQSSNADALNDEAHRIARQGDKLFDDYFGKTTKKLALSLISKLSKTFKTSKRGYDVYTAPATRDGILKEAASILKDLAGKVKGGKYKGAVPVAEVAAMLLDLGILNAEMLTLLNEFGPVAEQAQKVADAALDALKKARAAKERIDALEAQCRAARAAAKPAPSASDSDEDDAFKPSGQRELEAAIKLRETWRRADGQFRDSRGNWVSGDAALQRALAIVQAQGLSGLDSPLRWTLVAAAELPTGALIAQGPADTRAVEAGNLMAQGLERVARAIQAYARLRQELDRLGTGAASSAPKPAAR